MMRTSFDKNHMPPRRARRCDRITRSHVHPSSLAGAPEDLALIWYLPPGSENTLPPPKERARSHYGNAGHLPGSESDRWLVRSHLLVAICEYHDT